MEPEGTHASVGAVRRLALAIVTCCLAAAAPAAAAPAVLHVGDSLAVGSDPPLRALLPGWSFTTDALKLRPTAAGVAIIDSRPSLPHALVVELGTNDSPDATARFAGYVRHVVALAGPRRCVVWVNIHRPPYNGVSYAGYNRVLAQVAAGSPNLAVVDWNGMVQSGQAAVAGDGVHATPDGYRARAAAIAQALAGCSSQASAAPRVGGSHTLGAPRVRRRPHRASRPKALARPKPALKPRAIRVYTPKVLTRPGAARASGRTATGTYVLVGVLAATLLVAAGLLARRLRARRS